MPSHEEHRKKLTDIEWAEAPPQEQNYLPGDVIEFKVGGVGAIAEAVEAHNGWPPQYSTEPVPGYPDREDGKRAWHYEGDFKTLLAPSGLRVLLGKCKQPVSYCELVDALVGMACQYLERLNGKLDTDAVSAGEIAVDCLTRLGLVKDEKLINEAFNFDWVAGNFKSSQGTLESIIDAVLQHDAEHPDHGRGCACHDRHAGVLRRLLESKGLRRPEHIKSLQNVLTIVGYVTRNP